MKNSYKWLIAAGAAAAVPVLLLAPGVATRREKAEFKGRNYAHRGLHSRDKTVPENSLAAFALAAEAGYGIELDVQLSKDGQVVVFHDDTLDRVCSVSGRVDEFDYEELKTMKLCGTEETIPLFSDVLKLVDGRSTLIVELKPGKRNKELCKKTYELLAAYRGSVCIESFHPLIVAWFRFHAPELVRGQLAMPAKYYEKQSPFMRFMLANTLFNFIARPQFIAYNIGKRPLSVKLANLMGAMKICWTSHEPRNEKGMDGVIFEFYKPKTKYK
ncbi:MAG: glycerophosphodiester phosphodiesterase [Oscillospiraceae bacterium]|nr:glycerophosphodiester phosphodiesterase [Oscillospiraceae bacterium]